MNKIKLLITGGAGFIGSHLVQKYMEDDRVSLVRVVDDLSNGYYSNIERYINNPKFEFINDDISNYNVCLNVTRGINKVTHQAALGSVPRSILNPMRTCEVNIQGTVNLLHASKTNNIERIVLACSSSTYGDSKMLPKIEDQIGKSLSPYGVTKLCVELFADVFYKTYGLNYIGLRYFNVFGPNQNPNNPYAAVIPLFCKAFIENQKPIIFGDGTASRDFTYISNVIYANDLALFTDNSLAINQIFNIACGDQISLNDMYKHLNEITNKNIEPIYSKMRSGDIKHSQANINKANEMLLYQPKVKFKEGLSLTYKWYLENYKIDVL